MTSINSDMNKMTFDEITAFLNSGQYISVSKKKSLQNKLASMKIDKNFKNVKTKIKPIDDFPCLNQIKPIIANKSENLNFSKVLYDTNIDKKPNNLVQDKNLILSFNDIKSMYDDCAIYRIRLTYLNLNQMINILDEIEKIYPFKGDQFKYIFNYQDLRFKENKMRTCLKIYIVFDLFVNLLANIKNQKNSLEIKKKYNQFENVKNLLVDGFAKYLVHYLEITELFKTWFEKNDVATLSAIKNNINTLNKYIVSDMDPHTSFDYDVYLSTVNKPMVLKGISGCIYLSCQEPISLSLQNKTFDYETLIYLTEKDLLLLFQKQKFYQDHFIKIYLKNYENIINIHYSFQEKVPNVESEIQITDLPTDAHILTSLINQCKSSQMNYIFPTIKQNKIKQQNKKDWNRKIARDDLYKLSIDEYEKLPEIWRSSYSYMESCTNGFTVDYLFNQLLENDRHDIIKQNMFDSFNKLTIENSR